MQVSDKEIQRILQSPELVREIDALMEGIDEPEFETPASLVQEVTQRVMAMPDREDRIAELKARIEAGTYNVTSEQIVDAMVRRAIADRVR